MPTSHLSSASGKLRRLRHGKFFEEFRIRSIAFGKAMERGAEQLGNRIAGKATEWLHLDGLSCRDLGHDAVFFRPPYEWRQ